LQEDGITGTPYKFVYDIICIPCTLIILNYTMTPFVILSFQDSLRAWSSVYFCGHISVALVYVLALLVAPNRKKDASSSTAKTTKTQ